MITLAPRESKAGPCAYRHKLMIDGVLGIPLSILYFRSKSLLFLRPATTHPTKEKEAERLSVISH